jgi:hypothetical protein
MRSFELYSVEAGMEAARKVHELYRERFGHVPGEKTLPWSVPVQEELGPEEMRPIEEQFYWEDYRERNEA